VFLLPPESGEKITLTITILLALTVFLQLITEYTPKASKTLPLIGLYFNFNLILVLCSIILTIIVLNFQFRGPKRQRVPKWARTYVIGYVGRVFCFGPETRTFYTQHMVRNLSESSKKKKKNAAQEADGCKEIGEAMDKERVEAKETPSKKQEGLEADCRFASNESSCRNLEKLVRKMHRTADIFSLEDQTLKFSILKEVLECQRLLLTNTLSGQRPSLYVSSDEVYDESVRVHASG